MWELGEHLSAVLDFIEYQASIGVSYHDKIIQNGHRNNECRKVGCVDSADNQSTESQKQRVQSYPESQGQCVVHNVNVS